MNKKISILILIIFATIFSFGCSNKSEYTNTPLEPLEDLISIYYFDKGTYNEYKSLFGNKSNIVTKEVFDNYRSKNEPKDVFTSDFDSVSNVMKHMKVVQKDENNAEIYWIPNPEKDDVSKTSSYWIVTKQNGKWLLN